MARKLINITRRALFTWLLLGGFIILLIPDKITGKFQLAFAHIFHWPLNISRNLVLSTITVQPVNNSETERQIQLKNYIANLQARISELEKRNEQLAGFRSKNPLEGAKFILANITQATAEELIIDRGKDDGLATGQFVLGQNSVIGTIAEVSNSTAKVRLITSPLCKMEAKIADKPAVIQGDRKNVKIKSLQQKYKVSAGEQVFCQPKSGLLNTPIIIGTVAECKTGESPHLWDITIKPACNISALSSVDVIKY